MKKFYFKNKIKYIHLKNLFHFHLILNLNLNIFYFLFKKFFKKQNPFKRKEEEEEEEEVINRPTNPKEKNHPKFFIAFIVEKRKKELTFTLES